MKNLSLYLPQKNLEKNLSMPYFYGLLLAICLGYAGVEFNYIQHSIFSADDFWLAFHTYHFKSALPYRDFAPYKTVLGYYLLLIPMLMTHGTITTLIAVKTLLVLINTVCLGVAGFWLKKLFAPTATLFALAMWVCTYSFVAFSAEIRVDLLAYWLCFFSLLWLLEKKWWAAGAALGLALLVSQKALWSLVAIDCALLACLQLRALIKVNATVLALIACYILFWASIAGLAPVLNSVFYDAYLIANLHDYQSGIARLRQTALLENIFIFLAGGFGLLCMWLTPTRLPAQPRLFISIYAIVMALFYFSYQQPFLYLLLALMPALLLLLVILADWIFAVFTTSLARRIFVLGLIAGNVSIATASYVMTARDNHYQRNMLGLVEQLLQDPQENYVAGIPLVFSKESIVPGLTHLTVPQLNYLYEPNAATRKLMLASLYLSATSQAEVLNVLQQAPIKFYLNTNRINALPPALKEFLAREYQHFWGSIYLYAPSVPAGEQGLVLKFGGYYKIAGSGIVGIDGKYYSSGTIVTLNPGNHLSLANAAYRLQLVPEIASQYLDFKLVHDQPGLMLD